MDHRHLSMLSPCPARSCPWGRRRESFERKLERFRTAMGKNEELNFAMGAFWSDGSVDLPAAFRRADAAMYRDKQNYYRLHPELRRTHAAEDLL